MIVVLIDVPSDFDARVADILPDTRVVHGTSDPDLLRDATIILGRPRIEDLHAAVDLKWLQLSSAGANRYVGKIRSDVLLTGASGVFGVPAAEHAIAMMLALVRKIPSSVRHMQAAHWDRGGTYGELHGRTCGVLGLGDIGTEVARRADGLGMRVVAFKRTNTDRPAFIDRIYGSDALYELLAASDHIVNTLPETKHTYHLIDAVALKNMRPGAYFYNVGRGRTVDERALIEALQNQRLAGAGLDVFEAEPLPEESLLWRMPNVIVTPHVAGASPSEGGRIAELFFENLHRWVEGRALLNEVDLELGY